MNLSGEIKLFFGKDFAQIKFTETKGSFSIDTVMVPYEHRGMGIGTALVKRVIVWADELQKDVTTSARPIGVSTEEKVQRLVRFYEQFGFFAYDRGVTAVYMKRKFQNR
jgi:GNAT superfamily N-acetyltransferase